MQYDLVSVHLVAARARHALECPLERDVREGLDLAAVVADEVMVMIPVGMCGLETGDSVADIHALHEPQLCELLEHAVDARDADSSAAGANAVEDLLRGQATRLPAEVRNHGVARPPSA